MATDDDDDLARALGGLADAHPSAALHARIAADAGREAAIRAGLAALPRAVPSDLLMARTLRDARSALPRGRRGDRASVAGLAAAALVGLAVGLADPGGLVGTVLPATEAGYGLADIGPGYDFEALEGE